MNDQRHDYCTHRDSFCLAQDEPVITDEMFKELALPLRRLDDPDWLTMVERFKSAEPALSQLWHPAPVAWSKEAQAYCERLLVAIQVTFNNWFPTPGPIRQEELEGATGLILPYFRQPTVCLCDRFQAPLMKCVAREIEGAIDEGRLTTTEGNQIVLLATIAIEAVDQAAAAARWSPVGDKSSYTLKTNDGHQPGDPRDGEDPRENLNY